MTSLLCCSTLPVWVYLWATVWGLAFVIVIGCSPSVKTFLDPKTSYFNNRQDLHGLSNCSVPPWTHSFTFNFNRWCFSFFCWGGEKRVCQCICVGASLFLILCVCVCVLVQFWKVFAFSLHGECGSLSRSVDSFVGDSLFAFDMSMTSPACLNSFTRRAICNSECSPVLGGSGLSDWVYSEGLYFMWALLSHR